VGLDPLHDRRSSDLSLYLEVDVEPTTAPARTERDVTAELTAGWRDWVDDAIAAYVRRDSIRVVRWTVEFGDGARRDFAGDGTDRLATTHAYDAGEYEAIVTARVTGEAYGAFFTPEGVPYEQVLFMYIYIFTLRQVSYIFKYTYFRLRTEQ
jgi:hypothetical protein